jgi:hypothetical protein
MPPMTAFASEEEIAALPRRRVTLVPLLTCMRTIR